MAHITFMCTVAGSEDYTLEFGSVVSIESSKREKFVGSHITNRAIQQIVKLIDIFFL